MPFFPHLLIVLQFPNFFFIYLGYDLLPIVESTHSSKDKDPKSAKASLRTYVILFLLSFSNNLYRVSSY